MFFGKGISEGAVRGLRKKLVVNRARCPQNHRCPSIDICPAGALTQSGYSAPVADSEKCTGCGACVNFCPMRALSLE